MKNMLSIAVAILMWGSCGAFENDSISCVRFYVTELICVAILYFANKKAI